MGSRLDALSEKFYAHITESVRELEEMVSTVPDSDFHGQGEAGDLGAVNISPEQDKLDAYLIGIADVLVQEFEIENDDALEYVFQKAEAMAESGDLPPMPGEESGDQEVSEWIGAAQSWGFSSYVLKQAEAEADDPDMADAYGPDDDDADDDADDHEYGD